MVTDAPRDSAFLTSSGRLIGLAFDTEIHYVVSADGAVVDNYVPGPQGNSIPLFHLETLLAIYRPFGGG